MSQHVVSVAFDFDDAKVKDILEQSCVRHVEEELHQTVLKKLVVPRMGTFRDPNPKAEPSDPLQGWVINQVRINLDEWKDDICRQAGKILAESMMRSKPSREKILEIMKEELK